MAQLEDNNALLIYRVGPVLCCAPTLPIETLITPPTLTHPPGSSETHPGIFRHDGKLIRLTDLRQLFGVEPQDRTQPGRIIVCQLDEKYVGFLVDEIIDVIKMPSKGWGQLAPSLSGGVFSKSLLFNEKIYLYTELEKLQQVRNTGFLKPWIEHLHKEAQDHEKESIKTHTPTDGLGSTNKTNSPNADPTPVKTTATTEAIAPPTSNPVLTATSSEPGDDSATTQPTAAPLPEPPEPITKPAAPTAEQLKASTSTAARKSRPTDSQATIPPASSLFENSPAEKKTSVIKPVTESPSAHREQSTHASSLAPTTNPPAADNASHQDTNMAENNNHSGLLFFILLFIGTGLISTYIYLRPNQESPPDKLSMPIAPLASMQKEKPVITKVEPELEKMPTTPPISTVNTRVEKISANEVTAPPKPQSNESNYHAAIEQQHNEPGTNEITIILSTPNSNKVIHSETNISTTKQRPAVNDESLTAKPIVVIDPQINKVISKQHRDQIVHTVVKGDTLWHIAQRYIHNPFRYPELARLNKIHNPDLIYPGDRVRIIHIYQKRVIQPPDK